MYVNKTYLPTIWRVPLPTMFPGSTLLSGPKHSNSILSILELAVPLRDEENEGPLVPNPIPDLAVKSLSGPQTEEEESDLCRRGHSLFSPTLQVVIPVLVPSTVHVKEKVSPEHVGGAALNCPATHPEWETVNHSDIHANKKQQTNL